MIQRFGWFKVKSSGDYVRACQLGDRIYLVDDINNNVNNGYDAEAFEFVGRKN